MTVTKVSQIVPVTVIQLFLKLIIFTLMTNQNPGIYKVRELCK